MFNNIKNKDSYVHYIANKPETDQYTIQITTVGYQTIKQNEPYPPGGAHPDGYFFQKGYGRVLPEYQLVYIAEGKGFFQSSHCPRTLVEEGTLFVLFPGEWHDYTPLSKTGWKEYWVGFHVAELSSFLTNLPITYERPLVRLDMKTEIVSLFDELMHISEHELDGFQYICSGIIGHLIGYIAYYSTSKVFTNRITIDIMDKARALMRSYVGKNVSPELIAQELGVGYSWFRQTFKEVVGISPAQYQQQLRLMRAEFLLTNPSASVADVAFELGFANANQFSTFFKHNKHITPLAFRKQFYAKK